jgi:hypothetical protein
MAISPRKNSRENNRFKENIMTTAKIAKVMTYLNALCSWEGSDEGGRKEIQASVKYCEKQLIKLLGDHINNLPQETGLAIEYLKKLKP